MLKACKMHFFQILYKSLEFLHVIQETSWYRNLRKKKNTCIKLFKLDMFLIYIEKFPSLEN